MDKWDKFPFPQYCNDKYLDSTFCLGNKKLSFSKSSSSSRLKKRINFRPYSNFEQSATNTAPYLCSNGKKWLLRKSCNYIQYIPTTKKLG